jgi:hypothetical protein
MDYRLNEYNQAGPAYADEGLVLLGEYVSVNLCPPVPGSRNDVVGAGVAIGLVLGANVPQSHVAEAPTATPGILMGTLFLYLAGRLGVAQVRERRRNTTHNQVSSGQQG